MNNFPFEQKKIENSFIEYASNILGDTNNGLSTSQIIEYSNKYSVKYNVKIPFTNIKQKFPNKRTALSQNLSCFNGEQQFEIIKELCESKSLKDYNEIIKVKTNLFMNYNNFNKNIFTNNELIKETKHWLENYPESLKHYNLALDKFENNIFERNTLDDMRFAFELLLKQLLNNSVSLEKQISNIGTLLKRSNVSSELINMLDKIINYYTKFQNNNVKHSFNENLNKNEIEFIIELTSTIMKFLIKVKSN